MKKHFIGLGILLFSIHLVFGLNVTVNGTNTFENALDQAKIATEDVIITFSLANTVISQTTALVVTNNNGHSITIDGANNGDQGNAITLQGVNSTQGRALLVQSPNVLIKNLKIHSYYIAVEFQSGAENARLDGCEIENVNYGLKTLAPNCNMGHTTIKNCKIGVFINSTGFVFGEQNSLIGNNAYGSAGIWIAPAGSKAVIGGQTGNRSQYSFVGDFYFGMRIHSNALVRELIVGGQQPTDDFCSGTAQLYKNHIGIYVANKGTELEPIQIGQASNYPSVIVSNSIQYEVNLNLSEYVNVDNSYIGVDPAWCDHQAPINAQPKADVALNIYRCNYITAGENAGNTIGRADIGVSISEVYNAPSPTTGVRIANNYIGLDAEENEYGEITGVSIFHVNGIEIERNVICNNSRAIYMRGNDVSIKSNHIGITPNSTTVYGNTLAIFAEQNKNSLVDGNFFGGNEKVLFARQTSNLKLINNTIVARQDGSPIQNSSTKACMEIRENCVDIIVGLPGQGNKFIGQFEKGVLFSHFTPALWNDMYGNPHHFATGEVHSNIFHDIRTSAIDVGTYYHVKIGLPDDPISGNEVIKANIGIRSYSTATTRYRVIEAHHNYIGVSRTGVQGSLLKGILVAFYTLDDQSILANNVVTNCTDKGIHVPSSKSVKLSKNHVYNNTNNIFLNGSTNFLDGVQIEAPTISGSKNGLIYMLSGQTEPFGRVELFRQKSGTSGAHSYIGSAKADNNGQWSFDDDIRKHDNHTAYFATVTATSLTPPGQNVTTGITSTLSLPHEVCITPSTNVTETMDENGCYLIEQTLLEGFGMVNIDASKMEPVPFSIYSEGTLIESFAANDMAEIIGLQPGHLPIGEIGSLDILVEANEDENRGEMHLSLIYDDASNIRGVSIKEGNHFKPLHTDYYEIDQNLVTFFPEKESGRSNLFETNLLPGSKLNTNSGFLLTVPQDNSFSNIELTIDRVKPTPETVYGPSADLLWNANNYDSGIYEFVLSLNVEGEAKSFKGQFIVE